MRDDQTPEQGHDAPRSVVIFGAGEAGRRALARVRRDPSQRVVAFTDNNRGRHGTSFEGLTIVSPSELGGMRPDCVVVASQAWADIVLQLRKLGIPDERCQLFSPAHEDLAPVRPPRVGSPRLLVLTDDCIAPSHGTGAVLLRHFAGYPTELLVHGYFRKKGDPFLPHSMRIATAADAAAGARAEDDGGGAALTAAELLREVQQTHGRIDLVYSNFFGEKGMQFLGELSEVLDSDVPIVHHVHDLLVEDDARFDALLEKVAPRVSEFWAVGPGLGERVTRVTGREARPMNTFSCNITPAWKREHRPVDATFTAVMLGNSHMPWVMDGIREVWADVRSRYGLGPIRWFAYPTSLLYVERAGVRVEPDIEYYGYLSDRVLHEHLLQADLAIIPFNIANEPEYAYARYSIPSRLTEFMNAGLPVFAAAGRGTEAYRFITEHGVGECATLADRQQFKTALMRLIEDVTRRAALGSAARTFATTHGDVQRYRSRLFERIGALTGTNVATSTACAA